MVAPPSDSALTDALVVVAAALLKKWPANARDPQRLTEEVGALLAGVRAAEPAWGVRQTHVARVLGGVMKRLEDEQRSAGSAGAVEGGGGAEQSAARGIVGAGTPQQSGGDAASDEAERSAKALKQAAARAKAKARKAAEASATSAVAAAVAAATSHASAQQLSASCADLADWVVVDAMECC